MVFFKDSEAVPDIKERIDMAVFPALQGGPHNHQVRALAAQLLEVNTLEFVEYSKAVVSNLVVLEGPDDFNGYDYISVRL